YRYNQLIPPALSLSALRKNTQKGPALQPGPFSFLCLPHLQPAPRQFECFSEAQSRKNVSRTPARPRHCEKCASATKQPPEQQRSFENPQSLNYSPLLTSDHRPPATVHRSPTADHRPPRNQHPATRTSHLAPRLFSQSLSSPHLSFFFLSSNL
ncbi:hypothetical protein, partial [Chryseobacterium salipaludis]|uniref:hypothetical protein n=1 Tax=Planobacterium sp. JC490 TaxID=2994550 RepID=UPI002253BE66